MNWYVYASYVYIPPKKVWAALQLLPFIHFFPGDKGIISLEYMKQKRNSSVYFTFNFWFCSTLVYRIFPKNYYWFSLILFSKMTRPIEFQYEFIRTWCIIIQVQWENIVDWDQSVWIIWLKTLCIHYNFFIFFKLIIIGALMNICSPIYKLSCS